MKYLYMLPVFFFVLSACGQPAPVATPEPIQSPFDQFVTFDSNGYATVRGRIGGGSQCPGDDGFPATIFMSLELPVYLEDISANLSIPFSITLDTRIASEIVPETTARDFFAASPDLSFTQAFLPGETVEVTFSKQGNQFVAFAVGQVEPIDSAQFPIIESEILNGNEIKIDYSAHTYMPHPSENRDDFEWIVAYPAYLQGIEIHVMLPIKVPADVILVRLTGQVSSIPYHEIEQHRIPEMPDSAIIAFKHKVGILEAVRITEIEPEN